MKMNRLQRFTGTTLLALTGTFGLCSQRVNATGDVDLSTDFRYSPPKWQTAVCWPDDSDKILVGKEGQVPLDFKWGGGLDNFQLVVQPDYEGGATWLRQQTVSARAPIVQTWKKVGAVDVLEETFVAAPPAGGRTAARQIVTLVSLKNDGTATAKVQPVLRIRSVWPAGFSNNAVTVGTQTKITASEQIQVCGLGATGTCNVVAAAVELPGGATRQLAFCIARNDPEAGAITVADAVQMRDAARDWWETKSDLPFTTIQVPDAGIQAMLESCVRNIWQAREIKKGLPAFHVGPTVYRGLWVVDGSFLLETAALLGRGQDARAGIEYLLSFQKPDGSFEIIKHFWKENGIVLWAATRHAMLMQDKEWLRARWPSLQRVVKAIQHLRMQTLKDPHALDYGLLPAGFVDGGIDNVGKINQIRDAPEFSNTEWVLAGLKAVIAAAHWLDDEANAAAWQQEYDALLAAFRKAAARDTLKDAQGNPYVPTMMANAGGFTPQKGQWAFCHAVYPGQVFPIGDRFVEGQLAMLRATKVQDMVFDTGWLKDGLWGYFASFYGHALLWEGHSREAAATLYTFARHACPTRVWCEEQMPHDKGGGIGGDMPHNWASAEFIRLTTHLLELDRGDELHLLEGFPREWAKPGMVTKLNGVATPFGPLTMEVAVSNDGSSAKVKVAELKDRHPAKIVLHLGGLTGQTTTVELPTDRDVVQSFTR